MPACTLPTTSTPCTELPRARAAVAGCGCLLGSPRIAPPSPLSPLCSTAAVAAAHDQLKGTLGPARAAAMGLLACGAGAYSALLSEGEEAALEAGMREFGRAFHTIRAELLPGRTVFDLQNYYFNVSAPAGLHFRIGLEGGVGGSRGRGTGAGGLDGFRPTAR